MQCSSAPPLRDYVSCAARRSTRTPKHVLFWRWLLCYPSHTSLALASSLPTPHSPPGGIHPPITPTLIHKIINGEKKYYDFFLALQHATINDATCTRIEQNRSILRRQTSSNRTTHWPYPLFWGFSSLMMHDDSGVAAFDFSLRQKKHLIWCPNGMAITHVTACV
jgi:hypothetical protein